MRISRNNDFLVIQATFLYDIKEIWDASLEYVKYADEILSPKTKVTSSIADLRNVVSSLLCWLCVKNYSSDDMKFLR